MPPVYPFDKWLGPVVDLFYPDLCAGCGKTAATAAGCFCLRCQSRLVPVDMTFSGENDFVERLWGRLPLESGTALYLFQRKSPLQNALYRLKYHHQSHIGVRLGRMLGRKLRQLSRFCSVSAVIPVPLHPKKMRLRGYNQSALIASGISEVTGIPVWADVLSRRIHTASQTRKHRMERFDNVADGFVLQKPERVTGQHLLLVDDVLTTGATLEACGRALLAAPNVRLSMATVAIAVRQL